MHYHFVQIKFTWTLARLTALFIGKHIDGFYEARYNEAHNIKNMFVADAHCCIHPFLWLCASFHSFIRYYHKLNEVDSIPVYKSYYVKACCNLVLNFVFYSLHCNKICESID